MASKPATRREIGVPSIPLGSFVRLNCSRIPANRIKAKPKPIAVEMAETTLCNKFKNLFG